MPSGVDYDPISGPGAGQDLDPGSKEDVLKAQKAAAEAAGNEEDEDVLDLDQELEYPLGISDEETEEALNALKDEEPAEAPDENEEILALRAALAEMKAEVDELRTQKQAPAEEPFPDIFGEDIEMEEVAGNREAMNAAFKRVASEVRERTLRSVASTIPSLIAQSTQMTDAVKTFYEKNPDLTPVKGYVGKVANAVQAQHQDWSLAKILDETNRVVRSQLRLAVRKSKPTGFPGGRRTAGQRAAGTKSSLANELAELKALKG